MKYECVGRKKKRGGSKAGVKGKDLVSFIHSYTGFRVFANAFFGEVRVRIFLGFSCGVGCPGAGFFPVLSVVADEVGDFTKSLVGHGHVLVCVDV
jgi:hypothetical protein